MKEASSHPHLPAQDGRFGTRGHRVASVQHHRGAASHGASLCPTAARSTPAHMMAYVIMFTPACVLVCTCRHRHIHTRTQLCFRRNACITCGKKSNPEWNMRHNAIPSLGSRQEASPSAAFPTTPPGTTSFSNALCRTPTPFYRELNPTSAWNPLFYKTVVGVVSNTSLQSKFSASRRALQCHCAHCL